MVSSNLRWCSLFQDQAQKLDIVKLLIILEPANAKLLDIFPISIRQINLHV